MIFANPIRENEEMIISMFDLWRRLKKTSTILVSSNSMEPKIMTGASILVDHSAQDFHVGDIVVFKNRDHLTVHRIVSLSGEAPHRVVQTRGDNSQDAGEVFGEGLIMGRVIHIDNTNIVSGLSR